MVQLTGARKCWRRLKKAVQRKCSCWGISSTTVRATTCPRNMHPRKSSPCVRGNCDTEVDQMVLDFPILADYALICADGLTIFATHGHKFNCDDLPPMSKGTILLHGHTHVPVIEEHGDFTYINPGSVSIPKENSAHSYLILENGKFTFGEL